jgi:CheY-like chemotaxis protein
MHASRGLVLVIDDDDQIRHSTARLFETQGYRVMTADDGGAGIAAAARQRPDVILVDVPAPGLSGWDLLERLKLDATTREIPLVVFSGRELAARNGVGAASLVDMVSRNVAPMRVTEL